MGLFAAGRIRNLHDLGRALLRAGAFAGFSLSLIAAQPASPLPAYFKTGTLTFEDRVWAQTQIERVYYNHRIWPKENPQPKPPFEMMVPAAVIEAKVTDSLKKSAALDKFWQHPVTGEMLQAELDRMAKQTHDPTTLNELFAALHNDPRLIAETLARETLSDRLIRNWYAYDTRFHAEARQLAVNASMHQNITEWRRLGGEYHHVVYILDEYAERSPELGGIAENRRLNIEEFTALRNKYSIHSVTHATENYFRIYDVEEYIEYFLLSKAIVNTDTRIEVDTIVFYKSSFAIWWSGSAAQLGTRNVDNSITELRQRWLLPNIAISNNCDDWVDPYYLSGVPERRSDHTAVWTGSEMIVWGGYNYISLVLNTGGKYDPATNSWTPVNASGPNVPSARMYHTAIWTGSLMIVWGGQSTITGPVNTGGRYNPGTDTWTTTTTVNTLSPRVHHTAIWTGSEMIIWGGVTVISNGSRYDPAIDHWISIATLGAPSGVNNTAVWTGTEMIIWGGLCTGGSCTTANQGARYNPLIDTWVTISYAGNVPSPRQDHSAIWTGTEMIIWGGFLNLCNPTCVQSYFNSGSRYNPTTDTWTSVSQTAGVPTPRTQHTAVWTGNQMIIWGGNGPGASNAGSRYDPLSDSWQPTSVGANLPIGRFIHSAVWTGSEMIVWGGIGTSGGYSNTGGRYNPATDSWLQTSTGENIPAGRTDHTAIWTGSEMIIWGGSNNNRGVFFNSGGRFYPATNNWLAVSVDVSSPLPRMHHSAIWTGSDMVVWGGLSSLGASLNTGGLYNPTNDSWSTTSTNFGVPAAREWHTAVWTGNVMIVWGGSGGGNTGGRYTPGADTWMSTSIDANTPSQRYFHTSIWTGNEMIIWGGNSTTDTNSGGRYNPGTDAWQPISMGANVPNGRELHTAVWNGSKMIVWGGRNCTGSCVALNTGGIYSPFTDSWNSTPAGNGLPIARYWHTAVLSGPDMIIWGGTNGPQDLNTGARLNLTGSVWLTTSTGMHVPNGRFSHTAVMADIEMIVWGGGDALNDGGIYLFQGFPASPGNSLLNKKQAGSIELSWTAVTGIDYYAVKRCPLFDPICNATIALPINSQYSEPINGSNYFYRVESVNACGAMP